MHNNSELQVIQDDPYLCDYRGYFLDLRNRYDGLLKHLGDTAGGLHNFSKAYQRYGIHQEGDCYVYREWAPGAKCVYLFGEFNDWDRMEYLAKKDDFGLWQLRIDNKKIANNSKVKAHVLLADGRYEDRIPAWINFTSQNTDLSYDGVYIEDRYEFKYDNPKWPNQGLKIYECHVGMSGIQPKVHSYKSFRQNVVDRISALGYNVIQFMGILQHPYYGSFGYHVSNFFAVSSRFGSPGDFKELVDYAHSKGIKVLIDLVHAHAATNTLEGINFWDGTDYQYFHSLPKGRHELWDSRIFDYSKYEVLRFLLSNIRYWMQEYRVDGYRFDGVTSMIYQHHGIAYGFTGNYNQYFNDNLERDALVYLMLANTLIKQLNPCAISIAEDVSGFPGLCRTHQEGGIGFDFRLAMAIPDMWIRLLKEKRDEDWNIEEITHQLTRRRWKEKCIAYAESHDQALVGDKTLSMWLFDKDIYDNMSVLQQQTPRVFRGMALHKMIRLITIGLGGQGYLNFMGNEFGHPEWIDFPREGNSWSYHYCRRRWDLADDSTLRYAQLNNFDHSMIQLESRSRFLSSPHEYVSLKNNSDKVLVFERGDLLFVFNFHCANSFEKYRIGCDSANDKRVVLTTDNKEFGGHGRVDDQTVYHMEAFEYCNRRHSFLIYLPSRCAIVFGLAN